MQEPVTFKTDVLVNTYLSLIVEYYNLTVQFPGYDFCCGNLPLVYFIMLLIFVASSNSITDPLLPGPAS